MKKLVLILTALGLVGCGEDVPFNLNTPLGYTSEQMQKVKSAEQVLFEKCTELKDYLPDIINNKVEIYDAEGFSEKRDYGWEGFVEFNLEISESPKLVPSEYYAAGHHCRFRVSGNEVATQKTMCSAICTGIKTTESYMYIGKYSK